MKGETTLLSHPTSERLIALGLTGMVKALDEQRQAAATFGWETLAQPLEPMALDLAT